MILLASHSLKKSSYRIVDLYVFCTILIDQRVD